MRLRPQYELCIRLGATSSAVRGLRRSGSDRDVVAEELAPSVTRSWNVDEGRDVAAVEVGIVATRKNMLS